MLPVASAMQPEDGGLLDVFFRDVQQGKKKTGIHVKPFRKHAARRRLSALFALLLVNCAIAFLVVRCYREIGLFQQRRLAEGSKEEAGECSSQEEEESSSEEDSDIPSTSSGVRGTGALRLVEEVSAALKRGMRVRQGHSSVAQVVASSAVEGTPLSTAVYTRQLALLQLSDELRAHLTEQELNVIDSARRLLRQYLASRRRRAARWRAAVVWETRGAAAGSPPTSDSEGEGPSQAPPRSSAYEKRARSDLVKISRALKAFKPSSKQLVRPLLLAARFRLLHREVPERALQALAIAECTTRSFLSPEGVTNFIELSVIYLMALEMLENARSADEDLKNRLQSLPADRAAYTPEMISDLRLALDRAEQVRREVALFTRRLRLLDRSTSTQPQMKEILNAFILTDGLYLKA
ncbi:hypothetical protein Efla_003923 [Eimeria flavescens]